MSPEKRARLLAMLSPLQLEILRYEWALWARPKQLPPQHPWQVWLLLAGRGFGKTRAGAEWIRQLATKAVAGRLALVGETTDDLRAVMIEGNAGILAVSPAYERPCWQPSRRLLSWPNGVEARCFSADDPEQLRGPEMEKAWCDEIAKWRYPEAWQNMMLGLRLGSQPQVLATTTPRPRPWLKTLADAPYTCVIHGSSEENSANLAEGFVAAMRQRLRDPVQAAQELDGRLLHETFGSLWPRKVLDNIQRKPPPRQRLDLVVIGVDPAIGGADETGIIVAARDDSGICWVLEDASCKTQPHKWAAKIGRLAACWKAGLVVAEVNQGGDMIEALLRGQGIRVPVQAVRARRSKSVRAEPVAAAYAEGRVFHQHRFGLLEEQMHGCIPGETQQPSPDRMDAMVWALTWLLRGQTTRSGFFQL